MTDRIALRHPFEPVWNVESEILILGSFPSVVSRKLDFYYANPHNRFWKVLAEIYGKPIPQSVGEKRSFLIETKTALWDVVASCEISASADSSIKNAVANDIGNIIGNSAVRRVYANGATAFALYEKLVYPDLHIYCVKLPSTSPANAAWDIRALCVAWNVIKDGRSFK